MDDHWEARHEGDWHAWAPGYVVRARVVKELLEEAERLQRHVGQDDLGQRAGYADWLCREGLHQEGLAQLDKILAADADQPQALAILARGELDVGLPALDVPAEEQRAAVDALVALASRYRPAGRELAVARLRELGPDYPLAEELAGLLVHQSPQRRRFAAHALRRLYPGTAVRTLLVRAILDPERVVRTEAARALGDVGDEAVLVPVLRALESESSTVRTHAAQALGPMGYPAAVPALMTRISAPQFGGSGGGVAARGYIAVTEQLAYIQDFDVEIAQGASIADPIVGVMESGVILDARVLGMQMYQIRTELLSLHQSLKQLTGVDPGNTARHWEEWWENHRGGWGETVAAGTGG